VVSVTGKGRIKILSGAKFGDEIIGHPPPYYKEWSKLIIYQNKKFRSPIL